MDVWVAEAVMGLAPPSRGYPGRNYSTQIADAWMVMDVLRSRDICVQLHYWNREEPRAQVYFLDDLGRATLVGHAVGMPLAICRAALKAVSDE